MDPANMWRSHPGNTSQQAWDQLLMSLELLLGTAEQNQVILGIEPEPANVISSAEAAARLLKHFRSPFLKIIFDGANLIASGGSARQKEVLSEASNLLGQDIVLAHAKDLARFKPDGNIFAYKEVPAGRGELDYDFYIALLKKSNFNGPIILHGLAEQEVPAAISFLRGKLNGSL